jgi:hypothetical protein
MPTGMALSTCSDCCPRLNRDTSLIAAITRSGRPASSRLIEARSSTMAKEPFALRNQYSSSQVAAPLLIAASMLWTTRSRSCGWILWYHQSGVSSRSAQS